MGTTYNIDDLMPSEPFLDPGSLEYITQIYSVNGNFRPIELEDGPVFVYSLDGTLLVTGGNHRVSWAKLNGWKTIEAEPDTDPHHHGIEFYRELLENARANGVYSFQDLTAKIANPGQYILP